MKNLLTEIIRAIIDKYGRYERTNYFYKNHRIVYDKETRQYYIKPSSNVMEYMTQSEIEKIIKEHKKHAKM